MERVEVNGVELELDARGQGEPVLLIHGSIIGDAFAPLLADPALTSRYRLISYHRQGFLGSTHPQAPISIAEQAADAAAVLRHFGVDRAHIVGHSYGGVIGLQLALDAPSSVHSLALLEPPLLMAPSAEQFFAAMAPVTEAYQAGEKRAAIDGFLQGVGGPAYATTIDQTLPAGWFEQAVADADTMFAVELPAIEEWAFNEELAQRITQPVLSVLGTESAPLFVEGRQLLIQWLPQTETFSLPGATHMLQMQNPQGMTEALTRFFARHPLPVPA